MRGQPGSGGVGIAFLFSTVQDPTQHQTLPLCCYQCSLSWREENKGPFQCRLLNVPPGPVLCWILCSGTCQVTGHGAWSKAGRKALHRPCRQQNAMDIKTRKPQCSHPLTPRPRQTIAVFINPQLRLIWPQLSLTVSFPPP